jgi:HD-like signal output (HDOD) protein
MSEQLSLLDMIEQAIAANEVSLPARSQTAQQLQQILGCDDWDIQEILDLIESDQALTAEVLRVANSAFYGGLSEVATVRKAVVRIGGPEVVRLAIAATEKQNYLVRDEDLARYMPDLWQHSLGVALASRWLARKLGYRELESECFIAGLLHDVGKLLLVRVCDDLIQSGRIDRAIPAPVLREILEGGHCKHGATLLGHWGLPAAYQAVVLHHHDEVVDPHDTLGLIIRMADLACRHLGVGMNKDASLNLSGTEEANHLDVRDIMLAELTIMLEDSFALA